MSVRKSLSVILIGSQLLWGTVGFAQTSSDGQTPEMALLGNIVALEGQNLSSDAVQASITESLHQYEATAVADGQTQRLEDAFVKLGFFTPEQAKSFLDDSSESANAIKVGDQEALSQQIARVASLHMNGAQFSSCHAGVAVLVPGMVLGAVGGILWAYGKGGVQCSANNPDFPSDVSCNNFGKGNSTEKYVGIGLSSVGIAAFMVGALMTMSNC